MAFAAKYQAAAVLASLVLAHVQRGRRRRDADLLVGLGIAALTAVVAFPQIITELRRAVADVHVFLVLPSRLGYDGIGGSSPYAFCFKALGLGIGWPMLALACTGIVLAAARREWPVLVLGSLPICMYAVLGSSHMFVARYLRPGLPSLIVLASLVVSDVARRLPVAGIGLAAVVVVATLPNSLQFDTLLTRSDTRTAARVWVQTHLPAGSRILAEPLPIGPPLHQLPEDVVSPTGGALVDLTLDDYRRQGIEYLATSSYSAEALNVDAARDARRLAFYSSLGRDAQEVAQFVPYHGVESDFVYDRVYGPYDSLGQFDLPGPTIRIYQLSQAAAPKIGSRA